MDGTSMAGPHISGIVALMREACPDCDPQTIKEALISTAIRTGYVTPPATENNTFGNGFVDGYAAVSAVFSLGRVDGYVTAGGNPLPGARAEVVNGQSSALTDANGYYLLMVSGGGTYSVRYSKFGYSTHVEDNVAVVEGDTTHVSVSLTAVPNGILKGTVQMQSGMAASGARVVFPNTPIADQITDTLGHFVVTLPATGMVLHIEYVVPVVPPLGVTLDTTVTVNTGDTTRVTLPLFVPMVEPSTADAYGYRVYDHQDRDLPCPYLWTEMNPTLGGGGLPFTYSGNDSAVFLRSPFPLSFYGTSDDSLSVNCNGWMLPGIHHEPGRVDTRIPSDSASDPEGIIAPFWNDIRAGQGATQFTGLDSVRGRWVLEFAGQHLMWPGNYVHNWQVHFLDPAFHPTATGDCEIEFMYGAMGWLTASTIGIERPTENHGTSGAARRDGAGLGVADSSGSSMRFTTGLATQRGTATVNLTLYPAPSNGTPLMVKVGGRTINSTYGSALTADSVPAAPVSAVLMLAGYEMGRVDHVVVQPNQNANFAIQAWRLDPPRDLGGTQTSGIVSLQWRRPQVVEIQDYPGLVYSVYRNGAMIGQGLTDTMFTDNTAQPDDSTVQYLVQADYRHGRAGALLHGDD